MGAPGPVARLDTGFRNEFLLADDCGDLAVALGMVFLVIDRGAELMFGMAKVAAALILFCQPRLMIQDIRLEPAWGGALAAREGFSELAIWAAGGRVP